MYCLRVSVDGNKKANWILNLFPSSIYTSNFNFSLGTYQRKEEESSSDAHCDSHAMVKAAKRDLMSVFMVRSKTIARSTSHWNWNKVDFWRFRRATGTIRLYQKLVSAAIPAKLEWKIIGKWIRTAAHIWRWAPFVGQIPKNRECHCVRRRSRRLRPHKTFERAHRAATSHIDISTTAIWLPCLMCSLVLCVCSVVPFASRALESALFYLM